MTATEPAAEQTQRPLWTKLGFHLVLGAGALVLAMGYVGTSSFVFIDEGALLGQIELRHEGEWTTPTPLRTLEFDGSLVPMIRSETVSGAYAPYAKHPLYVETMSPLHEIGGLTAMRAFVAAGVLMAAVGSWTLARCHSNAVALLAFWMTLIASPLLFDAQLLIAHGPAAALSAWLFVAVDRWRGPLRWGAIAVLVILGSLMRSEFILLGLAVGAVIGSRGLRRRNRDDLATGAIAGMTALGTYLLEPRWIRSLIGDNDGPQVLSSASGDGIPELLDTFRRTLLGTSSTARDLPSTEVLFALVLAGGSALLWLRCKREPGPAVVAAGLASAAAIGWLASPTMASGFIVGFPLILLLLLGRGERPETAGDGWLSWLPWVLGLFALAILLTQYSDVGGFEWGWRYFALGVPGLTPFLAERFVGNWGGAQWGGRLALVMVAIAFAVVPIAGLREAKRLVQNTGTLRSQIATEVASIDADVFVSTARPLGRFAYEFSLEGDLALVEEERVGELLERLAARDVERVVLIWQHDQDPRGELGSYRPAGRPAEFVLAGVRAQLLELP